MPHPHPNVTLPVESHPPLTNTTNASWLDDRLEVLTGLFIDLLDAAPGSPNQTLEAAVVATPIVMVALICFLACANYYRWPPSGRVTFYSLCEYCCRQLGLRESLPEQEGLACDRSGTVRESQDDDTDVESSAESSHRAPRGGCNDEDDDEDDDDDDGDEDGDEDGADEEAKIAPSSNRACCAAVADALSTSCAHTKKTDDSRAPISQPSNPAATARLSRAPRLKSEGKQVSGKSVGFKRV